LINECLGLSFKCWNSFVLDVNIAAHPLQRKLTGGGGEELFFLELSILSLLLLLCLSFLRRGFFLFSFGAFANIFFWVF